MIKKITYFTLILIIFTCVSQANSFRINDIDINRINYALESINCIKKDWPDYSKINPAILLFGEEGNWLFNAIEKPDNYDFNYKYNDKSVYFNSKPISLADTYLPYEQVKTNIVGQGLFYVENVKSTHVYKKQPWFFISKLEDLIKNHPGFAQNTTTEEWLSIFIHEHFHIAQLTHPFILEFMNERAKAGIFITQNDLDNYYNKNEEYQDYIKEEYQLLSNSLKKNPTSKEAVITLKKWLKLYKKRIEKFNPDFSNNNPDKSLYIFDNFWTFIEGTARYVESNYLINSNYHPNLIIEGDPRFSKFQSTINKGYNGLPEVNKKYSRKYYYSIGMHLCFLLDRTGIEWKSKLFNTNDWLTGIIKINVENK